jgi:hypothetical protein
MHTKPPPDFYTGAPLDPDDLRFRDAFVEELWQLLRDLENDFYVAEVRPGTFDFASGLLKQWWKKYYA